MFDLGRSYHDAKKLEKARSTREELLDLACKTHGEKVSETIWVMIDLSRSYFALGRKNDALNLRKRALEYSASAPGEELFTMA